MLRTLANHVSSVVTVKGKSSLFLHLLPSIFAIYPPRKSWPCRGVEASQLFGGQDLTSSSLLSYLLLIGGDFSFAGTDWSVRAVTLMYLGGLLLESCRASKTM